MSTHTQICYHIVFFTKDLKRQEEHHRRTTFVEEYRKLLEEVGIEFDQRSML
jgi:hypothetical protein